MRNALLITAALGLAAAPAFAQTQPSQSSDQAGEHAQGRVGTHAMFDSTYESYSEQGSFDGEVAGGHSAEDLIDANVVNSNGETIGRIVDLAIGENGNAEYAVVELQGAAASGMTGGATGTTGTTTGATTGSAAGSTMMDGERHVLVSIDELSMGEGDAADDEFVFDKDAEELGQMPRFQKSDGGWDRIDA